MTFALARRMLSRQAVTSKRKSDVLFETSRPIPGSVFSFMPADGASRAGAVAQQLSRTLTEGLGSAVLLADFDRRAYSVWSANQAPRRLDGRTWGAFASQVDGIEVLNAREVPACHLANLFEYARDHYRIVCADLTGAKESHAREVLRVSEAIFLVSSSRRGSIEGVCEKLSWLRESGLDERCAMLLDPEPGGVSALEAEEITGLPLCSYIDTTMQIGQLARWLAANTEQQIEDSALALAG